MKRYEKLLIIIVVVFSGLQLLPNFAGRLGFFTLTTWLLALSYLIGGYWLFNSKDNREYFLPIVSGVAFAVSIVAIPFITRLRLEDFYYFLPVPNGLLCIGLTAYLIVNRKTENITPSIKNILKRSVIILAISSFFTYTPASFKPFREILMVINSDSEYLVNNLLMFEYGEEYENALENNDCDKAIEFALKSNKSGKIWIGIQDNEEQRTGRKSGIIDTVTQKEGEAKEFTNQDELYQISATYINLYKAYKCKADGKYDDREFSEALLNYRIAHKYLTACDHRSKYWNEEASRSLSNIAFCHEALNKYTLADSFHVEAIYNYRKTIGTTDKTLAKLYSNLASCLSEERQFEYSNKLFSAANAILKTDSSNNDNRKDLSTNYKNLAKNHMQQDSLQEALFFITKTMSLSKNTEMNFCSATLYHGICLYRLSEYTKADSVLKICLQCYKSQPKNDRQNIAECNLALSQVNIALAKYDEAKKYLQYGMQITTKNFGYNSVRYANYLKVLAYLNKIFGEYITSEKQYNEVVEIYSRELGRRNDKLPQVFSGLADLEITLSELDAAKAHSDSSISIASSFLPLIYTSSTELLNGSAYADYCLGLHKQADNTYRKVIRINNNYNLNSSATTAIAFNGLGLIETAKGNHKIADSLFQKSIKLHEKIFSDNNPLTAIVYLNHGVLCIQEERFAEAEEKINKSLKINKQFFKKDHDIFADVFIALGDLAKKKRQNKIANDNYKKALEIYKNKFNDKHWKVVATQKKLK